MSNRLLRSNPNYHDRELSAEDRPILRDCPFCDEPMCLIGGSFWCDQCDHSEAKDKEPSDPTGWEAGFSDNH